MSDGRFDGDVDGGDAPAGGADDESDIDIDAPAGNDNDNDDDAVSTPATTPATPTPPTSTPFERRRHVRYLTQSVLVSLPAPYANLDTNRLTMLHFAVLSLDVIGALDPSVNPAIADYKPIIVEWIYSLQLQHRSSPSSSSSSRPREIGGFKGGTYLGPAFCCHRDGGVGRSPTSPPGGGGDGLSPTPSPTLPGRCHDHVHIAMTYSALCTLATLGDDLSRIDTCGIINSLRALQRPDGCFHCVAPVDVGEGGDGGGGVVEGEFDMRFLYCAAAISHMLSDWSGVDVDSAVSYVRSCRSFDGGIGLLPGQEGHGGSTFCGVATLALMGRLDDVLDEGGWRDELIAWCVRRQTTPPPPPDGDDGENHGGMQGRPNKADDACYSYWIGGTLRLLGNRDDLLDAPRLNDFVLRCQHPMFGGCGKAIGVMPDLLHTFYSLAWLSLSSSSYSRRRPRDDSTVENERRQDDDGFPSLSELDCALGMCASRTEVFSVFR